ncbi:hypothetical protein GHT06_004521 [Daphnia sinensis]|uniref:Reverse transcriptase domain-containing protein n=1 Tax=Daphnia sinensis TaxID=1820382 RepID=A0AAD5KFF3_9CRUS|nr:hypothetical protein GHT06_004521 [Daphnia sinensis]
MGNAIVGVDFEKAYDLVNRDVLWRIMEVMGYPSTFVRWLQTIALVDDVTIFVSCDNDLVIAGKVLELFCQWTKARMNKQKTKALGLGRWRNRVHWPLPWLTSAEILPLLGIKFSSSISETADRVWNQAFGHLQVLQCSDQMADRILSAVMTFVWIGRIERPQRSVVYRPVNQGGLGMINTTLFYRSLFLCPIYKVLTGPDSPESSLLRFWLSFPLRNMLQLYNRNKPAAVIERPSYLLEPLRRIKDLLRAGILAQGKPMIHRKTYRHWIQEVSGTGKIEILRPDLDWPSIWAEIAA